MWSDRTLKAGSYDMNRGIFVDQKWINLMPVYFPNSYSIIFNPGYNTAYWNLYGREISKHEDYIQIDGNRLVFFHFSQFRPFSGKMSNRKTRVSLSDSDILKELFSDYEKDLSNNNYEFYKNIDCFYQKEYENNLINSIPKIHRIIFNFMPNILVRVLKYLNKFLNVTVIKIRYIEKYS